MTAGTLRWGILGLGRVARNRMIPALGTAERCRLVAVASRDPEAARAVADAHGVPRAHGSYEALLADPEVDAVYVALPNSLHLPWTSAALSAGKHVLCEKPLGLTAAEVERMAERADAAGRRLQEGFMIFAHPQWRAVRTILDAGRLGRLRAIHGHFGFDNPDPANIRNRADLGGGALLDVGCYPVTTALWLLDRTPKRVTALIDRDPVLGIDRSVTGALDSGDVQVSFFCSIRAVYRQTFELIGDAGRLVVELPFGPPPDRPCRLLLHDGRDVGLGVAETLIVPPCNQFAATASAFAASVLDGTPPPLPLAHSLRVARAIDALFAAGKAPNA